MKTPSALRDLVAELVHRHPAAHIEILPLPSGVCFLWVTVNERTFVLEYQPNGETGVSEILPDTAPFTGHEESFSSFGAASARIRQFLLAAEQPANAPNLASFAH